jgi:hypothetical protein
MARTGRQPDSSSSGTKLTFDLTDCATGDE